MATKRYKAYVPLQKLSAKKLRGEYNKKAYDENKTRVSVCSQTQHPLYKNPSFEVKLHTTEDRKHSV